MCHNKQKEGKNILFSVKVLSNFKQRNNYYKTKHLSMPLLKPHPLQRKILYVVLLFPILQIYLRLSKQDVEVLSNQVEIQKKEPVNNQFKKE